MTDPVDSASGSERSVFTDYLRGALVGAFFTGLALASAALVFLALGLRVRGDLNFDLDIALAEGPWLLLILPGVLVFLTLVFSPLAYLLLVLFRKFKRLIRRA